MISFILTEMRECLLWLRTLLILGLKFCFRWLLRIGMLAAIFFLLGRGCAHLSESVDLYPATQNTKAPVRGSEEKPVLGPVEAQNVPKPAAVQIKSAWPVLSGIARDIQRFFRKR